MARCRSKKFLQHQHLLALCDKSVIGDHGERREGIQFFNNNKRNTIKKRKKGDALSQVYDKGKQNNFLYYDIDFFFFFFFFFFCVPQLYLWGSPLLGEIFAYVTVF